MSDAPAVKKKFSNKGLEFIDWLLGRYPDKQAALLPVLRLAEEEFGNIDNDSVMLVAETLELSPGYVWGVLTFYTHYRREGDGKYLLQVCSTLPCALRGCRDIQHRLEEKLGIEAGEPTEDGLVTLKKVEWLGSCATAPVVPGSGPGATEAPSLALGDGALVAPLAGLEPTHTAPEADALSAELQGLVVSHLRFPGPTQYR